VGQDFTSTDTAGLNLWVTRQAIIGAAYPAWLPLGASLEDVEDHFPTEVRLVFRLHGWDILLTARPRGDGWPDPDGVMLTSSVSHRGVISRMAGSWHEVLTTHLESPVDEDHVLEWLDEHSRAISDNPGVGDAIADLAGRL